MLRSKHCSKLDVSKLDSPGALQQAGFPRGCKQVGFPREPGGNQGEAGGSREPRASYL